MRSESMSRVSPTLSAAPDWTSTVRSELRASMSEARVWPVVSVERPVTSIRSLSTARTEPTPTREASDTSTSVSEASRASVRVPAGFRSSPIPHVPTIDTARCAVPEFENEACELRFSSRYVYGGPELTGSRK